MAFTKYDYNKIAQVVDGDTIKIYSDIGYQVCRLEHIDAPEKNQPLWREAKDYIWEHWGDKELWIHAHGIDRYGRWLVTVALEDGRCLHWDMLKNGLAFHYRKYSNDAESAYFESVAKEAGIGLWAIPNAYTNWLLMLKEREAFEKKKQEEEGKIPCLVFNVWDDTDSNVPVDFIPEEMVFCKNYQKIEIPEMPKKPSDCYIGYIENERSKTSRTT